MVTMEVSDSLALAKKKTTFSQLRGVMLFSLVMTVFGQAHCPTEGLPVVKRLEDIPTDSYGRSGLTHMTMAGAVHHGMREVEVWMQTFAPGSGTPIHRHDCEEVFLVLRGAGTLYLAGNSVSGAVPGSPLAHSIFRNTTFTVAPNDVHQVRNSEQKGDLQLLVIISRPPVNIFKYETWDTHHSDAHRLFPYPWDRECPKEFRVKTTVSLDKDGPERNEEL